MGLWDYGTAMQWLNGGYLFNERHRCDGHIDGGTGRAKAPKLMLEAARRHRLALERVSFAGRLAAARRYGEALLPIRSRCQRNPPGKWLCVHCPGP